MSEFGFFSHLMYFFLEFLFQFFMPDASEMKIPVVDFDLSRQLVELDINLFDLVFVYCAGHLI